MTSSLYSLLPAPYSLSSFLRVLRASAVSLLFSFYSLSFPLRSLRPLRFTLLLSFLIFSSTLQAGGGNAIVPGTIKIDATFEHLGVVWFVEGDENLNSQMSLEFRPAGTADWQPGAVAMRAYPTLQVGDEPLGLNYWGASALFLEPGQVYDLRLTLTDPDGGGATQIVPGATRNWPRPPFNSRQLYVAPGNGGGDGSEGNPFLGLQTAIDQAIPGDTFNITPGIYAPFTIQVSGTADHPITLAGPGDGSVIIDGGDTAAGVVTIGTFDQATGHLILTGVTIQNGAWGIDAQNTYNIYIHHNLIQDVDFGVYNRRENGQESQQTVCDNVLTGRTPWPNTGIPGERGIDLRGTGNVVCHNRVRNFGDCVSVQPFTSPSFGNDVYGNDLSYCVDDGIEIDFNQANARVWRNRVMNSRMGVSVQPIQGGPAYIFRNELFNLESTPIKMHNHTTGFVVVHNTAVKHGNGHGDEGAMWRNAIFRNNLFLGTRYAFEFTTVADEGFRDFDYNGWGTTRTAPDPFFKWDNVRYNTIADLPAGVEEHGVEVAFADLLNATLPAAWDEDVPPGSRDLRLQNGVTPINAGVNIANLNDVFTLTGLPDLGAFELGQPLPEYGPRPLVANFAGSTKTVSQPAAVTNEMVTYTITLQNSGAPLAGTVWLTDTIPAGLAYVPGSFSASMGTVDDSQAPLLTWSGVPASAPQITLTYAVTVTSTSTEVLINEVTIAAEDFPPFTRSASLVVNGRSIYLPVLRK